MDDNKIKLLTEDGREVVGDILFTFDSDETKKSYIVYTDNSYDEEGNLQIFASIFNPGEENLKLEPIQTEKEWKAIEAILEAFQEEAAERQAAQTDGE